MPATITYSPQTSQKSANIIHVDTCDTRRCTVAPCPVPPLKGPKGTRSGIVSYRALTPDGAGTGQRVCVGASGSRPTAHYSLLTRLSPPASKPSNTASSANLPKIFVLLRSRINEVTR